MHQLEDFILLQNVSQRLILERLNSTGNGIVFLVDQNQILIGSFSDGDARRMYLMGVDLESQIDWSSRAKPFSLPIDTSPSEIFEALRLGYRYIPLLDDDGKVVDVAGRNQIRTIPIAAPDLGEMELANLIECFDSGWISSQGPFITEFEDLFAGVTQTKYALAVSNGTVAIQLALISCGVVAGDEVIVPDFTFGATINAVIAVGATPILVDVELETWTIDLDDLKRKMTPRTKAIIPVHIYGQPARCREIEEIALEYGLITIGDAAEALGAQYYGRPIGNQFDAQTFSFFANKQITTGEGGMIVFKSQKHYELARVLRDHGMSKSKRYWHDFAGFNYRMTNMQAAIGVAQIKRLDEIQLRRLQIFQLYERFLGNSESISFLPKLDWSRNSNWLFTIRLISENQNARDDLIRFMDGRGFNLRPGFSALHLMTPYSRFASGTFENSLTLTESVVSLPTFNKISEEDIKDICEQLLSFVCFKN